MSFNDIELLVLLAMMGLMFLLGLKRRESVVEGKYTGIDLPYSGVYSVSVWLIQTVLFSFLLSIIFSITKKSYAK